jgi:4-hydroxy-4-methyl-2-oxoglutarate aldolase
VIHADQHGFMVIPEEDREGLAEAAAYLDAAERATLIGVASEHADAPELALPKLSRAQRRFAEIVAERYGRRKEP